MLYFIFEGNFPRGAGGRAYIWKGDLTEGFLRYRFAGLLFGGAYTWRGIFSEFYGMHSRKKGEKTINMKAHTIRAEFVCLLIEPIFFRCSSHHHYFIISTSLPLFSQDLFELLHVLPQKSKFHHQAPFWKWKGAKFCINEFPRQWGWKEYPLTKSAE